MPQASAFSAHLNGLLRAPPPDPGLAIVFPGQGSHRVGAGRDLYERFSLAREVFRRCEDSVGIPLTRLCLDGPEEELRDTANAQPAILAVSLACLAAGLESGALRRRPAFLAGHSLGEFSALVAAGALELEDAASLVAERGRLMAEASRHRPGTMTAIIGLAGEALDEVCRESGVEPCNYNSPSQVVVGGTVAAVAEASRAAKSRGGRAIPLNVSGAFHTSLMAPAAAEFAAAIDACEIRDPSIPIVANCSGEPLTTADTIRDELREQIIRPVLWQQSMVRMNEAGVTTYVEAGPGGALSGLAKRSDAGLRALSLDSLESLDAVRDV